MNLTWLKLQNFRNHADTTFIPSHTTIIIGKNTTGKTNLLEAIFFLSSGKSFRLGKDSDVIKSGESFAKIEGNVEDGQDTATLTLRLVNKGGFFSKQYLVNGIPRQQKTFIAKLPAVLFQPSDLETLTASPSTRRRYIDQVLCQTSKNYRTSLTLYEKALKHRNSMLKSIKEGKKYPNKGEFEYWDMVLITQAGVIVQEREKYISFLNSQNQTVFPFSIRYDKSLMSRERLDVYFEIEQKTGVTLIGPQRDDFIFYYKDTTRQVAEYGSRGEQRLTILQLKLLEISFIVQETNTLPLLLLDDIFSELDSINIKKIIPLISPCQTIITTTHKEFIPETFLSTMTLVELSKDGLKTFEKLTE